MPSFPATIDAADHVLDAVLAEISEKLRAGEDVPVESYCREHPALADQLRAVLPAMRVLADLDPARQDSARRGSPDPAETDDRRSHPAGSLQSEFSSGRNLKSAISTLGDFRILHEIGRGGMGIVYEAEQLSLRRRVALKILPFAGMLDPRHLARFENEARAAATLHHENIVPVYFVGQDRGVHYYAMQLIRGQSLADVIASVGPAVPAGVGPGVPAGNDVDPARQAAESAEHADLLPAAGTRQPAADDPGQSQILNPKSQIDTVAAALSTEYTENPKRYFGRVAEIGIRIAQALDHAHQLGILHRDVKPANILLDAAGKPWITDFGLARIGTDPSMTVTGDLVGTLRYMSPEQVSGQSAVVDHRTDVYSLGITLYELATGTPAFTGHERADLVRRISEDDPRPPRAVRPELPPDLETIIHKAIEKSPADRYASAQELAEDLRRFVDSKPVVAKRASVAKCIAKWSRRNRAVVATSIVTLIVSLTVGTVLLWRSNLRTRGALDESATNLQKARAVVDDMYVGVAENWLKDRPHVTKIQRNFLEKAAGFYETLPAAENRDAEARRQSALVQYRLASIRCAMGQTEQATAAYRRSIAIYDALLSDGLGNSQDSKSLAKALTGLGRHSVLCSLEDAMLQTPAPRYVEPDDAQRDPELKRLARDAFEKAEQLLVRLAEENPGDVEIHATLAEVNHGLSVIHHEAGRNVEAQRLVKKAVHLMEAAVERGPASVERQGHLAHFLGMHARVLWELERLDEAERTFRRAVLAGEAGLAIDPESPRCREVLADNLSALGNLLRTRDNSVSASIPLWEQAASLMDDLVDQFPDLPAKLDFAQAVHQNLALAYQEPESEHLDKAIFHMRKKVEMHSRMVERFTSHPSPEQIRQLDGDFVRLGGLLVKAGRQNESVQAYNDAKPLRLKLVEAAQRDVDEAPKDDARRLRLYKEMIMYWSLIAATEGRESAAALDYEKRTQLQLHRMSAAPEITGPDLDGKVFNLSDYQGKVVMLDFFGNWCASCRVLYPMERQLVETYKDRPFALLGVNVDSPETLQKLVEQKEVTWRCWADGHPIQQEWRVPGYPTIYLIDHHGAVRHHFVGVPTSDDEEKVKMAVESLVREAERASGPDLSFVTSKDDR